MEFKKTWNEIPAIAKIIIIGGGGFLAYRKGKKIYERYELRKDVASYKAGEMPIIVTNNGTQVTSNINLKNIASKIHDAFYNNDWFGATEDEEGAINALKTSPKAYIPKLMQEYATLYNKNLHDDFVKFLDATNYDRVNYLFE
jgi:hypothetical protein